MIRLKKCKYTRCFTLLGKTRADIKTSHEHYNMFRIEGRKHSMKQKRSHMVIADGQWAEKKTNHQRERIKKRNTKTESTER